MRRLNFPDKKLEFLISLSFWLVYVIFTTSLVEEQTIYALTQGVVEKNTFVINSFIWNAVDKSYYNGNYYSDKAPGLSFMAVPLYAIIQSDQILPWFDKNSFEKIKTEQPDYYKYLKKFILHSFVVALIVAPLSALTLILIFRIAKKITNSQSAAVLTAISIGAGTSFFYYASTGLVHNVGVFFSFFAFYLIYTRFEEIKRKISLQLFTGGLIGFSIFVDYLQLIVAFFLIGYIILKFKNSWSFFLIGIFVGVLPLLIYNFDTFDNPLALSYSYHCYSYVCEEKNSIDYNPPVQIIGQIIEKSAHIFDRRYTSPDLFNIMTRMLIFPYKGLFIYSPILIFALFGFFYFYKIDPNLTFIILGIFVTFLIVIGGIDHWHGDYFGLRYLIPTLPFLALPLSVILNKQNTQLIVITLLLSTAVMFSSHQFTPWPIYNSIYKTEQYYQELREWKEPLGVPLIEHYFPLMITKGPKLFYLQTVYSWLEQKYKTGEVTFHTQIDSK